MDKLNLKGPDEEIESINRKLLEDNPIVEMKKINVDDYSIWKGWEFIRFCKLTEAVSHSVINKNPNYGKRYDNGYQDCDSSIEENSYIPLTRMYVIVGRREHSLCLDLKTQIDQASSELYINKELRQDQEKELEISKKYNNALKEDYDRMVVIKDERIKKISEDCQSYLEQKNKYEQDMMKLKRQFGEIQINKALEL